MYSLTILHRRPKQTSLLFAMGVKPRRVAHSIFTTQRKLVKVAEFTDKAISQNVRLLGCVRKTCTKCDNDCCTIFVAPTKKPLERDKRHNVVCNIAALNKISKNNQASVRINRPHKIKEGESSVCYGHMNFMLLNICHTEDYQGMKEANIIIHKTHV
jgi:hypothetical protein